MTLGALAFLATLQLAPLAGEIPRAVDGASRVFFVPSHEGAIDAGCDIQASRWVCASVPDNARGLIVLVGQDGVGWMSAGPGDRHAAMASWGRVVHIAPGSVAPDDLRDLEVTAWKPERPRFRLQTRHFMAIADAGVQVLKLSASRFWISGRVTDPDAFVTVEGPAIGSVRLATGRLADEPPEQIIYLDAPAPVTLQGQVRGSRGEEAAGADVELLEPLEMSGNPRLNDDTLLVHRNATTASADGTFRFDRVTNGPFRLTAWHPELGRTAVWTTGTAEALSLKLTAAPRVKGRVLKRGLPIAGARVRFVPDLAAWTDAADPIEYITAESTSADDGTFAVAVPAARAGIIQILTADRGVVRVPVPRIRSGELSVGDVAVPDQSQVVVRLADGAGCDVVAAGPLGTLGLVMIRATSQTSVYQLDLPESGSWALTADCRGTLEPVEPGIVTVPVTTSAPVDVRVLKPPGE